MSMSTSDMIRLKRLESRVTEPDIFSPYSTIVPANTPPNNAASTVFVISCIDPRFTYAVEEYLLAQLGPQTTYDLFVLAGSALGGRLINNVGAPPPAGTACSIVASNQSWREVLLNHIQVAISLHNVSRIYIIDHLDCAAYGVCAGVDTPASHFAQFTSLRSIIVAALFFKNGDVVPALKVAGSVIFGAAGANITGLYFNTPVGSTTELIDYTAGIAPIVPVGSYTFPPTSGAKILVLGCIDPRFSEILSSFLTTFKEVQFIFDLFITAGSSLGVNQSYLLNGTQRANNTPGDAYPLSLLANAVTGKLGPLGHKWGPVFFDHLTVAFSVHNITEVWVFDHLDCGAYKAIKFGNFGATDLDPAQHIPEIVKLQGFIKTARPSLAFKGFIMDTAGTINKVVDDTNGVFLDKITFPFAVGTFGSSRIRAPASEIVDLRARSSADYVLRRESQGAQGFSNQLVRTKLTPVPSVTSVLETKVGPLKSTLLNRNRL